MKRSNSYIREKLSYAVSCLNVDEKDICKGLLIAYDEPSVLVKEDFPSELQQDWGWIVQQLTKCNNIKNTISIMENTAGMKIAEKIRKLHSEMCNESKYP